MARETGMPEEAPTESRSGAGTEQPSQPSGRQSTVPQESVALGDVTLEDWLITENENGERIVFVDSVSRLSDGSSKLKHYNFKLDPDDGSMQMRQVSKEHRSAVNSEAQRVSLQADASEPETFSDASGGQYSDIVERSDHYIIELDECGAYDYTHKLGGVTVEFTDGVSSYAPETVGAAILTIAGASAELGGMFGKASAIAIGTAAMQFTTDSLSVTSVEYDTGFWVWTQTMYKVNLSPNWHEESPNAGVPVSTAPSHPARK